MIPEIGPVGVHQHHQDEHRGRQGDPDDPREALGLRGHVLRGLVPDDQAPEDQRGRVAGAEPHAHQEVREEERDDELDRDEVPAEEDVEEREEGGEKEDSRRRADLALVEDGDRVSLDLFTELTNVVHEGPLTSLTFG